jgi:hypothetical protein
MLEAVVGQPSRAWPDLPTMPEYYLRWRIGPAIRRHRDALKGFGQYWECVRVVLPEHMNQLQRIDLKLRLMEAWISKYGVQP